MRVTTLRPLVFALALSVGIARMLRGTAVADFPTITVGLRPSAENDSATHIALGSQQPDKDLSQDLEFKRPPLTDQGDFVRRFLKRHRRQTTGDKV
ncbi:MAG TPA: hypothetical protein VNM72_04410 [Blastocatellia bacterium]|nr:hypothetical protein [Blastocatellia bacterium]